MSDKRLPEWMKLCAVRVNITATKEAWAQAPGFVEKTIIEDLRWQLAEAIFRQHMSKIDHGDSIEYDTLLYVLTPAQLEGYANGRRQNSGHVPYGIINHSDNIPTRKP